MVATLLRLKSCAAHDFLKDYIFKLPCRSTIRRELCEGQVGEGFLELNLLSASKVLGPGPCALLFDEISLKEDCWLDKHGSVRGFSEENPDKMIKSGLVFMTQSLVSGKSCAIGWYGTSSVNGAILKDYRVDLDKNPDSIDDKSSLPENEVR